MKVFMLRWLVNYCTPTVTDFCTIIYRVNISQGTSFIYRVIATMRSDYW